MYKCEQCGTEQNTDIICIECGEIMGGGGFSLEKTPELSNLTNTIKYFKEKVSNSAKNIKAEFQIKGLESLFESVAQTKAFLNEYSQGKKEKEPIPTFINRCDEIIHRDNSFQIAFAGTIKAGKSTLINAMLKKQYASVDVTPETAVLTKFKYGEKDSITIKFYNESEWEEFFASATKNESGAFLNEYKEHNADIEKSKWVGREPITEELTKENLSKYTSKRSKSHYFAKEVIITMNDFPFEDKNIVFVDTPGLDDPMDYRSKVTRDYINKANVVLLCVQAKALTANELATIIKIFDNTGGHPKKVYVLGTQYDTLNKPKEEWAKQKEEWIKHLSSNREHDITRFNKKLAERNIFAVSGHIACLLDSYENGNLSEDDKKKLVVYALDLFDKLDFNECKEELRAFSNISHIEELFREDFFKDIQEKIIQDSRDSCNILFQQIQAHFNQLLQNAQEIFDSSNKSLQDIEALIKQEETNMKEIKKEEEKLNDFIEMLDKSTDEAIEAIEKQMNKAME